MVLSTDPYLSPVTKPACCSWWCYLNTDHKTHQTPPALISAISGSSLNLAGGNKRCYDSQCFCKNYGPPRRISKHEFQANNSKSILPTHFWSSLFYRRGIADNSLVSDKPMRFTPLFQHLFVLGLTCPEMAGNFISCCFDWTTQLKKSPQQSQICWQDSSVDWLMFHLLVFHQGQRSLFCQT